MAIKFGSRLLPTVLENWANNDPDRPYALYPRSPRALDDYVQVTMRQMIQAVDRAAWWLETTIGKSKDFQTLAYIGPSDLRYPVLMLAAIKVGWKTLLLGTRNALSQNQQLLKRTKCEKLFYAQKTASKINGLQVPSQTMNCYEFQPFEELLDGEHVVYPWEKTFEEARDDPVLILHSSGTTGDPKLVTMTHGTFSATDLDREMPVPSGRRAQNAALYEFKNGGRAYCCFPLYHLAGVQAFTSIPLFYGCTAVYGPIELPASGWLVSEIIRQTSPKAVYVPPAVIEEWVQQPGAIEQAKTLDFVLYGGGPLSSTTGNLLEEYCRVCQVYGSAEIGVVQLLIPEKGNWGWLELNPFEELDMQYFEEYEAYEMVLHRREHLNRYRFLYHNFPQHETWRTGDLFKQHPEKPGLWKFVGRVDDLILLSNSFKINPVGMETRIQGHPLISGAIVIGTKRPRPALILEARQQFRDLDRDELIKRVWPTVEEVNSSTPEYAQILRSMIILADWDRPFSRAPKGSIVRSLSLQKYSTDIEALYSQDTITPDIFSESIEDMLIASVTQFLLKAMASLLPKAHLSKDDDFFHHGLDSLKVAELRKILRNGLRTKILSSQSSLPADFIYRHPTVSSLARAICTTLVPSISNVPQVTGTTQVKSMVEKFSSLSSVAQSSPSMVVVMTGTSGTLGRRVLQCLLAEKEVTKVYCLTRSIDGAKVQASIFEEEGMDLTTMSKAEFLTVDLSQHQLGLSTDLWQRLTDVANLIIHAAWNVDFNLPLNHFETYDIKGLHTLIDFSNQSRCRPRIAFMSSITSLSSWDTVHGSTPVPEAFPDSYDLASDVGYYQSKLVAEHMLKAASRDHDIPVTIFRIGQIAGSVAGPTKGRWPRSEWVPLLAQTSKSLGLVPSMNAVCDWMPIDAVAQTVHEILFRDRSRDLVNGFKESPNPTNSQVYNLVNPRHSPWFTFAEALRLHLGESARMVTLHEWIDALKLRDDSSAKDLSSYPALKILPFFEGLAARDGSGVLMNLSFDTANAVAASSTMSQIQPVGSAWVEQWIRQWGL